MKREAAELRESKSTTRLNILSKYVKGKQLGKQGGFAKCYEFTETVTGKVLAAKVIEKATLTRDKAKDKLKSEIQIHRNVAHQYIVKFETAFEDSECYYIIMELCPNQTLNELVRRRKRLTQIEAQCFLFQLASALDYLHKNKVIHRDLKLSNLFLSDKMEIKVGDLGLAAKLSTNYERRKTVCGTPNYIAPEILDGVGHSYEVDIWSYGVIAYALMVGRLPFENKENNVNITYNKIRMCNYSFPEEAGLSKSAKNFISKLLQIDPSKRMTIDEIFSHDFLTATPFPKTLPLSSLAQPPTSHFLKQFAPTPVSSQRQQVKPTRQSSKDLCSRRNSSTQAHGYLQARMSSVDLVGRKEPPKLQQKLPRPSSTTLLSKWKTLIVKDQKQKQKQKQKVPSFYQRKLPTNEIEQWIINFVNSQKYGTCYCLNSGAIGMMFNDNTCLISDAGALKMKYLQLSKESSTKPITFDVGAHHPTLSSKIKVFQHYKNQLLKQKQQAEKKMSVDQLIRLTKLRYKKETKLNSMNIFLKRSGSREGFRYFLLSNNVLQGIFKDGSQILVCKTNNLYINKFGQQKVFHKSEELTGDTRIQYQFLLDMLKNSKTAVDILNKQNQNLSNTNNPSGSMKKQISASTNDSKENSMGARKLSITLSKSISRSKQTR